MGTAQNIEQLMELGDELAELHRARFQREKENKETACNIAQELLVLVTDIEVRFRINKILKELRA